MLLGGFFGRNFWWTFLGGFFWEVLFWRICWEDIFGRNYLVEIKEELIFLSRFLGNFVSMQEGMKEGKRASLDP